MPIHFSRHFALPGDDWLIPARPEPVAIVLGQLRGEDTAALQSAFVNRRVGEMLDIFVINTDDHPTNGGGIPPEKQLDVIRRVAQGHVGNMIERVRDILGTIQNVN